MGGASQQLLKRRLATLSISAVRTMSFQNGRRKGAIRRPNLGFRFSFEAGNCVPCTAVVEAVAVVVGAEEEAVAAEVEWSDSRAVLR